MKDKTKQQASGSDKVDALVGIDIEIPFPALNLGLYLLEKEVANATHSLQHCPEDAKEFMRDAVNGLRDLCAKLRAFEQTLLFSAGPDANASAHPQAGLKTKLRMTNERN